MVIGKLKHFTFNLLEMIMITKAPKTAFHCRYISMLQRILLATGSRSDHNQVAELGGPAVMVHLTTNYLLK